MVEFAFKPVEIYGRYSSSLTPIESSSSVAPIAVDEYGRLITTAQFTGTILAENRVFSDAGGTLRYGLVDSGNRIILSPSSTVQTYIAPSSGSTVEARIIGATTTIPVSFSDNTSTVNARLISTTATIPVVFATTSTVQAVTAPSTGSTVEARLISTTATIPVSFSDTTSTVNARLISTTATIPVSFATTSTVQAVTAPSSGSTVEARIIGSTATIPVSFATTSTVQSVLSATTATIPVSFSTSSTIQRSPISASTATRSQILNATTTSATIPANANRRYMIIRNLGNNIVLLKHGGIASTNDFDFYLDVGDAIEYSINNLWTGYISYVSSTNSSTLTCLEW